MSFQPRDVRVGNTYELQGGLVVRVDGMTPLGSAIRIRGRCLAPGVPAGVECVPVFLYLDDFARDCVRELPGR